MTDLLCVNLMLMTRYILMKLKLAHDLEWVFHMAKVNCLAWAPDSVHLASGSLDTAIIIWDAKNPTKHITYKSMYTLIISCGLRTLGCVDEISEKKRKNRNESGCSVHHENDVSVTGEDGG